MISSQSLSSLLATETDADKKGRLKTHSDFQTAFAVFNYNN